MYDIDLPKLDPFYLSDLSLSNQNRQIRKLLVLRPESYLRYIFSGLKDALFNSYLLEDASYLLFSLVLITLLVWAYTASLTITIASLSSIAASLGLAFFTYTFVLRLTFFPFMNVLAAVIALGVGADDTFILSRSEGYGNIHVSSYQNTYILFIRMLFKSNS